MSEKNTSILETCATGLSVAVIANIKGAFHFIVLCSVSIEKYICSMAIFF